jgi:amino acid transporter
MKKIWHNLSLVILGLTSLMIFKTASAAILPNTDQTTWHLCKPGEAGCTDIVNLVIGNATSLALSLAGGIAIAFIIYAGFTYMTAYGNEARATQAKTIMLYAIIGLVIIILARVIYGEVISIVH